MNRFLVLATTVATIGLHGCATTISESERTRDILPAADLAQMEKRDPLKPGIFLRTYDSQASTTTLPVRVVDMPFSQLIETAVPGYTVVSMDAGVDTNFPITLSADGMRLSKLLESVSGITGYDLKINGTRIEASAYMSKEWILPMFSVVSESIANVSGASSTSGGGGSSSGGDSGGGGGGGGGGGEGGGSNSGSRKLSSELKNKVDDWDAIVKHVEDIVKVDTTAAAATPLSTDSTGPAATKPKPPSKAHVEANRPIGYIRAYGPAAKVKQADAYLTGIIRQARKQVRLDVRSVEVSFKNSRSRGVNWDATINTIFDGALGKAGITLGADYTVPGVSGDGVFSIGAQVAAADDKISAMLDFLASYGNVEVQNKPQVTVFNGRTAYVGSGQEFGYVAKVEQTINEGTVLVTTTVERLLVGVELSITPRVLDNNNILLEIVPVVSTLNGFDTFSVTEGPSGITQPRIVLNQLSTSVVVPSGKPIHLGGLITSRLNEAMRGLPLKDGSMIGKILGPAFSGDSTEVERRELIIVVTPFLANI